MDSVPAIDYVPTLHERLDFLRKASAMILSVLVNSILELWTCLPQEYLWELGESDRTICLRGSLMCWAVTQGTIVPREMQLRSILADQQGRDSLISASTGSGKTLPIAICTLLDDPARNKITIIVSPLKQLQKSQANEFTTRFGIRAVAINEDTPQDSIWWSVSCPFVIFYMCIYSHIRRKTYSLLNPASKCTHNSLSSQLNNFSAHRRDISLEWPSYCDSLHSSRSFLGSASTKLTHFILLAFLCMVYLRFGLPGENFTSSKRLFSHQYRGISSQQHFRHTSWT